MKCRKSAGSGRVRALRRHVRPLWLLVAFASVHALLLCCCWTRALRRCVGLAQGSMWDTAAVVDLCTRAGLCDADGGVSLMW